MRLTTTHSHCVCGGGAYFGVAPPRPATSRGRRFEICRRSHFDRCLSCRAFCHDAPRFSFLTFDCSFFFVCHPKFFLFFFPAAYNHCLTGPWRLNFAAWWRSVGNSLPNPCPGEIQVVGGCGLPSRDSTGNCDRLDVCHAGSRRHFFVRQANQPIGMSRGSSRSGRAFPFLLCGAPFFFLFSIFLLLRFLTVSLVVFCCRQARAGVGPLAAAASSSAVWRGSSALWRVT